jgi:hypothetical protein
MARKGRAGVGMSVPWDNVYYMWNTIINPRVGDVYVFGGSLNPQDLLVGTDCSGLVSEVNEALLFGPQMNYTRQFWTGTFAGANPGDHGPFGGVDSTAWWVCTDRPENTPADAAMIVAVLQLPDPSNAHMVCRVQGVNIESGGQFTDDNGNSTMHIGSEATPVTDSMFNQFFYLPGPITGVPPWLPPQQMAALASQGGDSTSQVVIDVLAAQFAP